MKYIKTITGRFQEIPQPQPFPPEKRKQLKLAIQSPSTMCGNPTNEQNDINGIKNIDFSNIEKRIIENFPS